MTEHEELELVNGRGTERYLHLPRALSAKYDRRSRRIVIQLSSNMGLFFSPRDAQGLQDASAEDLSEIEISPSGYGIHFPRLDADLYLPGIMEGKLGSERWMAERAATSAVTVSRIS